MARIRIVDEWLRSPASQPSYYRSIMVVAEQWAEQRVLMRAYAESGDQSRPTIVLHGQELAIGPAGTDPHGAWGIHVQPPADGRAQELAQQLELAARRLAGTRGNPPRLEDEASAFERKRTNNWAPGAPRDLPGEPARGYFEPSVAASGRMAALPGPVLGFGTPAPGAAQHLPAAAPAELVALPTAEAEPSGPPVEYVQASSMPAAPAVFATASDVPGQRLAPVPVAPRRRGWTSPIPPAPTESQRLARTALGYTSGAGAQSAVIRLGLRPGVSARLARLIDRTVPADFEVTQAERDVLNALGESGQLTARAVAGITGIADALTWMDGLMGKLARHGLDIVAPGEPAGGEPTYVLIK